MLPFYIPPKCNTFILSKYRIYTIIDGVLFQCFLLLLCGWSDGARGRFGLLVGNGVFFLLFALPGPLNSNFHRFYDAFGG